MRKLFSTFMVLAIALFFTAGLFSPMPTMAQSRVVLVGGGEASKPLDDFMLDADVLGKGDKWYVDNAVTASGDGKSWDYAFKTIQEAITAAGDWDTIQVAIGLYYDEAAALNITQRGLKLFGANKSGDIWGFTSIIARAEDHRVITVNANDVEIAGFAFVQDNAKATIAIATTVSSYKTFIHHCYFGGTNVTYGIAGGLVPATTYDSVDVAVQNCTFYQNATGVDLNGSRCTIRDNVFMLAAGDVAINVTQTGGSRPDLRIIDNIIKGANSTDSGITFTGTPTEGRLIVSGNKVYNVATPIALSKYTSWYEGNYWGIDDANYHQGWGRADCEKRGANGRIFYVDLNMATTGLDGLSWASAFDTVAAGLAAADTWIGTSGNRAWAKRATVFSCHDGESETLVLAAEKTDLVGIGYDIDARPMLTGNFTIGSAVSGFRIFNYSFVGTTTAPVITFPSGMHGWELHDVTIYKVEGVINTSGISATTTRQWTMKNVQVLPDAGGARNTIGVTFIGDSGAGLMENCYIEGIEALDIANPSKGTILKDSTLVATALALDDNSDDAMCINMRFITDAAAGSAGGSGIADWNAAKAVGCEATSSDSAGPMPNLDALN